jgi:hypothetical protein
MGDLSFDAMLSEEQIVANWEKYSSLLLQTGEHRSEQLQALLDHLGDRLVMCPASSKSAFHNCFVGGLVDHSLRVLKNCTRLMKVSPDVFGGIPEESVVFAALLHDLGKVGDLENDRYLPQTNNYYRERGNLFEHNHVVVAKNVHASLFLLQHFGVKMTYDEFEAILLNDGPVTDDGREYCMKETPLALLVQTADRLSCEQEKFASK